MNTSALLRPHATLCFLRWMHVEESISTSKDWSRKNECIKNWTYLVWTLWFIATITLQIHKSSTYDSIWALAMLYSSSDLQHRSVLKRKRNSWNKTLMPVDTGLPSSAENTAGLVLCYWPIVRFPAGSWMHPTSWNPNNHMLCGLSFWRK